MRTVERLGQFTVTLRAFVIVGLVWFGSNAGLFESVNGLFQDASTRWLVPSAEGLVVVVDLSRAEAEGDLAPMVATLARLGAAQIVLAVDPGDERFPADVAVVVGIPAGLSLPGDGRWDLARPLPAGAGAIVLPPARQGIHREQVTVIETQAGPVPTIEAVAAGVTDPRPFHLRFAGGVEGIAHVAGQDLLAGRVPEALVAGRVALIGHDPTDGQGLAVPLDPTGRSLRVLDFHAFALQTLLSGKVPRGLPWAGVLVLLAATALIAVWLFQKVGTRGALWVLLAVVAVTTLAAVALQVLGSLLLPVGELLALQVAAAIVVWHHRERMQDETLLRTTRDLEAALGHSDRDGALSYPALASILELRRSALLLQTEKGRLIAQPAAAEALAGLPVELREGRDPSFAEAARKGAAVVAHGAASVRVVPLEADGRLVGYWLIEPADPSLAHWEALAPAVTALARDLARLASAEPKELAKPRSGKALDHVLTRQISTLREQMRSLEQAMDHGSTAIAVRDLLGESDIASARFSALAAKAGIPTTETDPVRLVVALTGLAPAQAAEKLRLALLQGERVSLPIVPGLAEGDAGAVLRLSTLAPDDATLRTHILFEVADQSEAMQLARLQSTVSEQLNLLVRNDLEAVQLAATLIAGDELPAATRPRVLARLEQAVARAKSRLAAVEPFLSVDIGSEAGAVRPVDLQVALSEATSEMRAAGVPLDMQGPDLLPAVIAAPEMLRLGLRAVLSILQAEARPGHPVTLMLHEDLTHVHLTASIDSSSLSDARLQAYLDGSRPAQSEAMRTIAMVALAVPNWGGALQGRAETARSLQFELALRKLV